MNLNFVFYFIIWFVHYFDLTNVWYKVVLILDLLYWLFVLFYNVNQNVIFNF